MSHDDQDPMLFCKGVIKPSIGAVEIKPLGKLAGFGSTLFTVHAGIFPFDGEWPLIVNGIEFTNYFFEVNSSPAWRPEIPSST